MSKCDNSNTQSSPKIFLEKGKVDLEIFSNLDSDCIICMGECKS